MTNTLCFIARTDSDCSVDEESSRVVLRQSKHGNSMLHLRYQSLPLVCIVHVVVTAGFHISLRVNLEKGDSRK